MVLDGAELRVLAALRVRRSEWTEDFVLSSDAVGCEIARNWVGGPQEPGVVRVAWTVAPDFARGGVRPINPWGLVRGARGRIEHGAVQKAELDVKGDLQRGDGALAFQLAQGTLNEHRLAARGSVSFTVCPADPASTGLPMESPRIEIGKQHIPIRSVRVHERLAPKEVIRFFDIATEDYGCDDHAQREVEITISPTGEPDTALVQVTGRAVPAAQPIAGKLPLRLQLPADASMPIVRAELPVGLEGRGRLGDVDVVISGRVSARVCSSPVGGP
jgi:hypothetical protein